MDEQVTTTNETPAKKTTEYRTITMQDGREVKFAGKRKSDKTTVRDDAGKALGVRFDFDNGETRTLLSTDLPGDTAHELLAHGIAQKVGDEWSGETNVDDMVLSADSMIDRLKKGEFAKAREAGDSFSGASTVIRALVNVTGKSVDAIKKFLDGKLEKAKTAGEKLTRQDLYKSLRAPDENGNPTRVSAEIMRLEQEIAAKSSKVKSAELIADIEENA